MRYQIPFGWLVIGVLLFLTNWASVQGQTISPSPRLPGSVSYVESVGFTVSDMDKAIDFYTRILPFEKVSDTDVFGSDIEHLTGVFGARIRVVRFKLGDEILELTEYLTQQGRPIPVDSRSNDLWFQHIAIIVSDMDRAYQHLRKNKVRHASTAPQKLPEYIKAAAGIEAFYFKDFDNHILEILAFPPDKGAKKWHDLAKDKNKLFLGIDHTAIAIGDTDASLRFYRDSLGMEVAGNSENYGTEQEHLNNVFGAKLLITGLKTKEAGIAVEFLQYLAPTDGKSFPKDTRSSDLWHWQISFVSKNNDSLLNLLIQRKFDFVSTGLVSFDTDKLGFKNAMLVRDTDGHATRIIER